MKIKSLKLNNYRNYKSLDLLLNENITVLHGDNGQGKTNILEAIYLFSTGKSYRTSKESDLVKFGGDYLDIFLDLNKDNYDYLIRFKWDSIKRKQISINEIPITKIGDLIGLLNAVIFAPEDMMIIKDGPSNRRRFMDIALSQISPSYFYNLQQYSKILKNRNMVIKEIASGKKNDSLDVWNQSLASYGSKIMIQRTEYLAKLSYFSSKRHQLISSNKEELSLYYKSQFKIEEKITEAQLTDLFVNLLEKHYRSDLVQQSTMVGPHRDDIVLKLNDMDLRHFGSQGQQRTAILSLKLAEVDLMSFYSDDTPVLLLDDVFSELDDKRQETLLKCTESIQTVITCTDMSMIKGSNVTFYNVVDGQISV